MTQINKVNPKTFNSEVIIILTIT